MVNIGRYMAVPRIGGASQLTVKSSPAPQRRTVGVERRFGKAVVAFLTTAAPCGTTGPRNPSYVVACSSSKVSGAQRRRGETWSAPLEEKLDPAQYEPQVRIMLLRNRISHGVDLAKSPPVRGGLIAETTRASTRSGTRKTARSSRPNDLRSTSIRAKAISHAERTGSADALGNNQFRYHRPAFE